MKPVDFEYHRAESLQDALERLGAGGESTKLICGGQSLGPMLNLRLARPRRLVDIASVPALRTMEETRECILIGAAITHAEIEDGRAPDCLAGGMRNVAAGIAYRAVRNKGTLGGSIAHADPCADWMSFLLCVDARVHACNAARARVVPMTSFTRAAYTTALDPSEIVTHVEIPRYAARARLGFFKLCRKVGEFAHAIGAVLIDPDKRFCRVVVGAIGSKPVVLDATTRALAGSAARPELEAIEREVASSTSETDPAKLHMSAVAVGRAIDRALAA